MPPGRPVRSCMAGEHSPLCQKLTGGEMLDPQAESPPFLGPHVALFKPRVRIDISSMPLSLSNHASRLLAQPVGKVSVRAGRIKSGRPKRKEYRQLVDTQKCQGTNMQPSTYLAGPQGTHEPHKAASVPMAQGWYLIVPSYEHKDLGTAFSKP